MFKKNAEPQEIPYCDFDSKKVNEAADFFFKFLLILFVHNHFTLFLKVLVWLQRKHFNEVQSILGET